MSKKIKKETVEIHFLRPDSIWLTPEQVEACYRRLKKVFPNSQLTPASSDDMTEEDILNQAQALGFIELPEGWKT